MSNPNRKSFLLLFLLLGSIFNTALASSNQPEVDKLEKRFERQIDRYLLTSPAEDNAAETLQRIAELNPKHPILEQGPMRISKRYVELAEKSINRNKSQQAISYLNKALLFQPKSKQAVKLRAELDLARSQRLSNIGHNIVPLYPGCFQMGTPEVEPHRKPDERAHKVCLKEFGMAKYEVTFAEFDRFTTATGAKALDDRGWGRGERPAVGVTWKQAANYAKWLSKITNKRYRLPTEAEWEYAARASSSTAYSTGEKITKKQANVNPDHQNYSPRGKTQAVGKYKPNAWGLYDMHGNVWEWTCSFYDPQYKNNREVKCYNKGNGAQHVLRGGSWYSRPVQTRSAYRGKTQYIDSNRGFRLVQEFS